MAAMEACHGVFVGQPKFESWTLVNSDEEGPNSRDNSSVAFWRQRALAAERKVANYETQILELAWSHQQNRNLWPKAVGTKEVLKEKLENIPPQNVASTVAASSCGGGRRLHTDEKNVKLYNEVVELLKEMWRRANGARTRANQSSIQAPLARLEPLWNNPRTVATCSTVNGIDLTQLKRLVLETHMEVLTSLKTLEAKADYQSSSSPTQEKNELIGLKRRSEKSLGQSVCQCRDTFPMGIISTDSVHASEAEAGYQERSFESSPAGDFCGLKSTSSFGTSRDSVPSSSSSKNPNQQLYKEEYFGSARPIASSTESGGGPTTEGMRRHDGDVTTNIGDRVEHEIGMDHVQQTIACSPLVLVRKSVMTSPTGSDQYKSENEWDLPQASESDSEFTEAEVEEVELEDSGNEGGECWELEDC